MNDLVPLFEKKYGIANILSEHTLLLWKTKTLGYINSGIEPEVAGRAAAVLIFLDYNDNSKIENIISVESIIKRLNTIQIE